MTGPCTTFERKPRAITPKDSGCYRSIDAPPAMTPLFLLVGRVGIEPTTNGLKVRLAISPNTLICK